MRDLRVKDFDAFDFKPKQLVQDICQVYINLGPHEVFCRAVSGDGRSYSYSLFVMADRVLKKIGAPVEVVTEMNDFANRVRVGTISHLDDIECCTFPLHICVVRKTQRVPLN